MFSYLKTPCNCTQSPLTFDSRLLPPAHSYLMYPDFFLCVTILGAYTPAHSIAPDAVAIGDLS